MANASAPSPATCQSTFEQGVALSLHLWPALTLAVQNQWGGPDSADKRDWFAGAVIELFPDVSRLTAAQLQARVSTQQQQQQPSSQPQIQIQIAQQQQQQSQAQNGAATDEPDQADVEDRLLQIMLDEFGVNVDDDSAFEVAEQVVRLRGECLRGRLDGVEALRARWEGRKGSKVVFKQGEDQEGDETDWDTDDSDEEEDDDGGDGDVEMGEAAPPRRERAEPEVDEEGFTKVTRKKR